jgi:predicted SprT family Zn-dependent metalloprotease
MSFEQLQLAWSRFNLRYFRNALPSIRIEWSARLTASAGMFVSCVGPRAAVAAPPTGKGRMIRLSLPLLGGQPEPEILSTLAHEMIHQWQFDHLKRRPNHGPDFRRIMRAMNQDGLGITVRHDLDEAVQAFMRYVWRCTQCGRDYHRQRRTIRPRVHRCGSCRGSLREIKPAHMLLDDRLQLNLFR